MAEREPQVGERWLALYSDGSAAGVDLVIDHHRPVDDLEFEAWVAADRLLRRTTTDSSFYMLTGDAGLVLETLRTVRQTWTQGRNDPEALRQLRSTFRAFLSGFRAFVDHTSHELSATYGRQSAHRQAFLQGTRAVYDANFAYRLSCTLRNAAQHTADILNYVRYTSHETSPGRVASRVDIGIDGPKLVASGAELKAGVRDELSGTGQPLMLESLLDAVMGGCEYLFALVVVGQEQELSDALAAVGRYEKEHRDNGPGSLAFTIIQGRPVVDGINTIWIENKAAISVRRVLPQCQELASAGPASIGATDLY